MIWIKIFFRYPEIIIEKKKKEDEKRDLDGNRLKLKRPKKRKESVKKKTRPASKIEDFESLFGRCSLNTSRPSTKMKVKTKTKKNKNNKRKSKSLKSEIELDAYLVKLRNLTEPEKEIATFKKESQNEEEEATKEKLASASFSNLSVKNHKIVAKENGLEQEINIFTTQKEISKEKQMEQRIEMDKINREKTKRGQQIYDDCPDYSTVVEWIRKNQEEAIACGCMSRHPHHFMILPTNSMEHFKSLNYDVNCFDKDFLTNLQPKGSEHFQKKGAPLLFAGEKKENNYDAGEMFF